MKTLILFPLNPGIPFNTSAAALAGVARQNGFDCVAYPIADEQRVEQVLEDVLASQPDVVCATFMTRDIPGFRTLFSRIKQHSNAITAVGGYHATIRPRHVAKWAGVDAIGIGEGERALLALLRAAEQRQRISTLPGLWVRSADGFTDPIPAADPELDIANLPPWDYSALPSPLFKGEAGKHFLVTRTSRACPFSCSYCSVPVWEATNGLRTGQLINIRPVQHVCDELAYLRDRYAPTDVEFWDPQFPFANQWLEELAERFPAEVGLPFRALMHVKTLNPHRIQLLAKAGCTQLYFGIESGDAEFRKTVLNKACSDDDIVRTVARVKDAGISACAFVMWNLPGETRKQAARTIAMVDRTGFDRVRINCYIPLPGTVLGDPAMREFPDAPVETFEPLPEWNQSGYRNWSAMSEAEYQLMRDEFAKLQNRHAEKGHTPGLPDDPRRAARVRDGANPENGSTPAPPSAVELAQRISAERLQRLAELLGFADAAAPAICFRLKDVFSRPAALTLVLIGPDEGECKVTLRPSTAVGAFYTRTDHCLISYEGAALSTALGETIEHIRQRIERVPFEQL